MVAVLGTEIPRQLQRLLNNVEIVGTVSAIAVLIASPARDLDQLGVSGAELFWTIVFALAVAVLTAVVMSVVLRALSQRQLSEELAIESQTSDGTVATSAPVLSEPNPPRGLLAALSRHFGSDVDGGTIAGPLVAATAMFVLLGLALNTIGGLTETPEAVSYTHLTLPTKA